MSASTGSQPPPLPEAEVVFEGRMAVAPPPAPIYQYAIVLKHDKIRFWLEDSESKKRWQVDGIALSNGVHIRTQFGILCQSYQFLPPSDYIEGFHGVMNTTTREEATDIPVGFYTIGEGKFRLELAVKVQFQQQDRVAMYSFDFEEISVERIDVLEAKICQLQEVVAKLQKDLDTRDAGKYILHAQGTGKFGDTLAWDKISDERTRAIPTSVIPVDAPGIYQAVVVVNREWKGSEIKLMRGHECIQSVYCGYSESYPGSTTLTCINRLEKGDQLAVVCAASIVATNRLTLVRIGT